MPGGAWGSLASDTGRSVFEGFLNRCDQLLGGPLRQGRCAEAEKQFKAAIGEAEMFGEQDQHIATSLNKLAALYYTQGKYVQAEPLYQRSLAILQKALGPEHPNLASSLENYARLLRKMDRNAEAKKLEARAEAIRAKHAQENPP